MQKVVADPGLIKLTTTQIPDGYWMSYEKTYRRQPLLAKLSLAVYKYKLKKRRCQDFSRINGDQKCYRFWEKADNMINRDGDNTTLDFSTVMVNRNNLIAFGYRYSLIQL